MKPIKCFIVLLCCVNFLFSSEGGGFFEQWFMPDTALFLWSVVTFLIVLGILRWKAWGPLMDTLDARAKQIEESLSKAEKVTAEAEQQAEKNEKILNVARKEAQEIVGHARETAEGLKSTLESKGKDQYDAMLDKALIQIEAEKQKALSEIKHTVVDIAIKASEKVIKRNLNTDDNKKMIEQTVDEFKKAN
jgi:F-type H+-transporting ATPase subunit b